MHFRAISNTVSQFSKFSNVRENLYSKAKGWIDFSSLNVLEAKIIQYGFLQEHKVCKNNMSRNSELSDFSELSNDNENIDVVYSQYMPYRIAIL